MFKAIDVWERRKLLPMRWAGRQQAQLASRVVSLGGGLTKEIRDFLDVEAERIDILPNAIDLVYIDKFRENRNGRRGENVFIFVGRLETNKGVGLLCQAFKYSPLAKLIIVGSGRLEEALRHEFEGGNIEFSGRLDDKSMFERYRSSSCFIFPSLYEGMPTVILEAMAHSLPVIATDIGAVTTMVDSENGIVVRPNSVAELRNAVATFLTFSEETKAKMGQASRRRVQDHFTWPKIAAETARIVRYHNRTSAPSCNPTL
jgi:glycosyltransferase involved in cell wall biosynthesis